MKKYLFLISFLSLALVLPAQKVEIFRLDKVLYDCLKTGKSNDLLEKKNLPFLDALSQTLNIPPNASSMIDLDALGKYYEHPTLWKMYGDTEEKFKDMSLYEQQLATSLALAKTKMNITDNSIFYTHVSGLKENIISVNNIISISLDKYLGSDYGLYTHFFNQQQLLNMSPEMIVRDYIKAWLIYNYVKQSTEDNLLSEMVFQGKVLYIMSQILPDYTIAQLIGKTETDLEKCKLLAKKNWKKIQANDLYTKDNSTLYHWMEEESELGAWLGYEIVSNYMINTHKTIDQLLNTKDSEIFKEAKYIPR